MRRGIELQKARTAEEPFNNEALLDNGIILPPIFLTFIQCVQTGDFYGFFKLEKGAEFEQDHTFSYLTTIKSGACECKPISGQAIYAQSNFRTRH